MQQHPTEEFIQAVQTKQSLEKQALERNDPDFTQGTDEQKREYIDSTVHLLGLSIKDLNQKIETTLTPEQMLKVRKAEQHKKKPFASGQEMFEAIRKAADVFKPSAELLEKERKHNEKGVQFTALLKSRFMNVLTDEQLDKMQKIMDETPCILW